MSWDIETARKRIGLQDDDTARDDDLDAAMAVALAAAESYCDRAFLLQDDEQEFSGPLNCLLLVKRYPLVELYEIAPLDPNDAEANPPVPVPAAWRMDKKRGIVFVVGAAAWPGAVAPVGSTPAPLLYGVPLTGFVLTYRGGFDPLPADLEAALWMIFDELWATSPGWGAEAGSQSAQSVKSFAIDGMTINYQAGGDSATGAGGGGATGWGPIPPSAAGILRPYRAESAALGG